MMGHSHALTGLAAGAATAPAVADGWPGWAGWTVAVGGMALLPDLDQTSSTASHMWGPASRGLSWPVALVSRGHRHGTHDLLLAPAVFGALAWAAAHSPWGQMAVLAVAVGLALCALSAAVPGKQPWDAWPVNLAMSGAAAWALVAHGQVAPAWLPAAVAAGVVVHALGDLATDAGLPLPLVWIARRKARLDLSCVPADSALLNGAACCCSVALVGWSAAGLAGALPAPLALLEGALP